MTHPQTAQPLPERLEKLKSESPTRLIDVGSGLYALIDADNFDWLASWSWRVDAPCGDYPYAVCRANRQRMHRLVMHAKPGQMVDHINGDTLDNRRSNLRICTAVQNRQNSKPQGGRKFKGVVKKRSKYEPVIRVNGRIVRLGVFDLPETAARAYDSAAAHFFGQFARLNFPREIPEPYKPHGKQPGWLPAKPPQRPRSKTYGRFAPWAKLTEADALYIKSTPRGSDRKALATRFGITVGMVSRLRNGTAWKWMKPKALAALEAGK